MSDEDKKEMKSVILKFRVTPSFKQEIKNLRDNTSGCKNMELQQFVVRLIELGIEEEKKLTNLKIDNNTERREAGAG